jgi:hypothetical protein
VAQAQHQLDRYAALLWSELAIKPSAELTTRVAAAAGTLHHPLTSVTSR